MQQSLQFLALYLFLISASTLVADCNFDIKDKKSFLESIANDPQDKDWGLPAEKLEAIIKEIIAFLGDNASEQEIKFFQNTKLVKVAIAHWIDTHLKTPSESKSLNEFLRDQARLYAQSESEYSSKSLAIYHGIFVDYYHQKNFIWNQSYNIKLVSGELLTKV